ncbi:trypsin-like serine protease [Corallincola spongiicola]|uniref:Serine protease n=1 Tax=Corallincola spongiicola TaxID=2520508 RepID=A0ABY1WV47_9GAMM|nr:trypsin-like serine protease [Corallincola spongiicola]TAA48626.1 trypsin-like serine protease [Corallincola spongiicola]
MKKLLTSALLALTVVTSAQLGAEVIGSDERSHVVSTHVYPYRAIGLIQADKATCTATLIDKTHVVTAAHCLFDVQENKQWKRNPYFIPGKNGSAHGPFGVYQIKRAYVDKRYIRQAKKLKPVALAKYNAQSNAEFHSFLTDALDLDIAIAELDRPVAKRIGFMELKTVDQKSLAPYIHLTGYPSDKTLHTQWTTHCQSSWDEDHSPMGDTLVHKCDTSPGMSGAVAYVKDFDDKYYAVGLFSVGTMSHNFATPFDNNLRERLIGWKNGIEDDQTMVHNFQHEKYHNVHLVNECRFPVYAAINYKNLNGEWVTSGWRQLDGGESAYVASTKEKAFYVYAKSAGDPIMEWTGSDKVEKIGSSKHAKKYGLKRVKVDYEIYTPVYHNFNC